MNYLLKCSLWYSMLSFAFSLKLMLTKQNEVELNDEYGEDLNTIESTMNQIEKMSQKRTIKEIKKNRKDYCKCFSEQEFDMYNNIFDV